MSNKSTEKLDKFIEDAIEEADDFALVYYTKRLKKLEMIENELLKMMKEEIK